MKTRKKLIEVALPLDAINTASAREKQPGIGKHPRGLHLWWARRPLATARAVIFAQMVDDPATYVDTLLADPHTRRAAERDLRTRREFWLKRKAEYDAATGDEDVTIPEPGQEPTLSDCAAEIERQRLFRIIEDLVLWRNTTNETVLERARAEIWQTWRRACADNADHPQAKELFDRNRLPAFHDPFAGGGALPLEAQRLGLEVYATDLNPVAVLINKAMIEIPPKFASKPPVNPKARVAVARTGVWNGEGAEGLAEDVRHYGQWIRDQAEKRIGNLYPKVTVTPDMAQERPDLRPLVGRELTVIAWLWARTVKSPNPAFRDVAVPLASTFMLSTKAGKEAYVEPVIEGSSYRFAVKAGKPKDVDAAASGTKLSRGANFRCLVSGATIEAKYARSEAQAGRMGARLMAVVAQGDRGRVYLSPLPDSEAIALATSPSWKPDLKVPTPCHDVDRLPMYGMPAWGDAFTPRQLVALTTFSDLVREVRERVRLDAIKSGFRDDDSSLGQGALGALAYAEAVSVYLAFAVSRLADFNSSITTWKPSGEQVMQTYKRQALQMTWDFPESNVLGETAICWSNCVKYSAASLEAAGSGPKSVPGLAHQRDAGTQDKKKHERIISTDPPYYDNIGYADLSDFFYVWLRRSLKTVFPDLFATLDVPKTEELVASPYRHGGKREAEAFFLEGMTRAMHYLAEQSHPEYPVTIYYAFKQSETKGEQGVSSTGWETFLDAVIRAGFGLTGTWPMRTELANRMIGSGTNALASSIVLVCRPRAAEAPTATRREFLNALKAEMPAALAHLQRGNIAPVDLAQASIGPGMAIYTRYASVVDAAGKPLDVRDALAAINETLDEVLAEQEGDFDADSRWAVSWFEQFGFADGDYGVAETLSKAKNTSAAGMVEAGIIASKGGKVRLLKPDELPEDWDPATDSRLTAWETVHQLVRVLEAGGEAAAAALAVRLGVKAEAARELAYRLYAISERKKRAAEALSYNSLVQSWPEIIRLAREASTAAVQPSQTELFGEN